MQDILVKENAVEAMANAYFDSNFSERLNRHRFLEDVRKAVQSDASNDKMAIIKRCWMDFAIRSFFTNPAKEAFYYETFEFYKNQAVATFLKSNPSLTKEEVAMFCQRVEYRPGDELKPRRQYYTPCHECGCEVDESSTLYSLSQTGIVLCDTCLLGDLCEDCLIDEMH